MKNLRQILLILILFLTVYCGESLCQKADSYSNKTVLNNEDTLRTVAKALSSGVRYMELYELQLETSRYYDSMYTACINQPSKTIQVIEKETNWLITGVVSVLVLLANWAIYLAVIK